MRLIQLSPLLLYFALSVVACPSPAAAQSTGQFSADAARGEQLIKAGEYDRVKPIVQDLLQQSKQDSSSDYEAVEKLGTLIRLASLFSAQGQYEQALQIHECVLAFCEKEFGPNDRNSAVALNNLAWAYFDLQRYAEAEPLFKRVLATRDMESLLVAKSLRGLALVYSRTGRYAEAEPHLKQAVDIQERESGKDDPETIRVLNDLAIVQLKLGRYAEAEQHFRRLLDARERAFGKKHAQTVIALNNLATVYRDQERYAEAEPLFKQALGILEELDTKGLAATPFVLDNLAVLYTRRGEYAKAEPLQKRAIALWGESLWEDKLGEDHAFTARGIQHLGMICYMQGNYEQAQRLFKQALSIRQEKSGEEHPDTASSLHSLAMLYQAQEKWAKAEPLLKQALDIRDMTLGKDHPDTVASRKQLAFLHQAASPSSEGKADDSLTPNGDNEGRDREGLVVVMEAPPGSDGKLAAAEAASSKETLANHRTEVPGIGSNAESTPVASLVAGVTPGNAPAELPVIAAMPERTAAEETYLESVRQCAGEVRSKAFKWNGKGLGEEAVPVTAMAVSPDGRYLCTGNKNIDRRQPGGMILGGPVVINSGSIASARIWDLESGRELRRLIGHHCYQITSVAFSPDSSMVATCGFSISLNMAGVIPGQQGRGEETRLWDVQTGEELNFWDNVGWSVAFSRDGSKLLTADTQNGIVVIDVKTGSILNKIALKNSCDVPLIPTRDPKYVVFAAEFGGNIIWKEYAAVLDLNTGKDVRKFGPPDGFTRVESMALSVDGQLLAVGYDGLAVVWDYDSGREIRRFEVPGEVSLVELTPDGRNLIAISSGGRMLVFEMETGDRLRDAKVGRGVHALSPDGRILFHADDEGHIDMVETQTEARLVRFHQFATERYWFAETADGFCAGSDDLISLLRLTISDEIAPQKVESLCKIILRLPRTDVDVVEGAPPIELKVVKYLGDAARIRAVAKPQQPDDRIQRVELTLDGRPVFYPSGETETDGSDSRSAEDGFVVEKTVLVPPGQGRAILSARAVDSQARFSASATIELERPRRNDETAGRLFVLAVGVSEYHYPEYKLKFSANDAEAVAQFFRDQRGRTFSEVLVQVFTDKKATISNVKEGLDWLQRSCTPADGAVVLFCGHGIRGRKGLYYVTHEGDAEAIHYTCLNWSVIAETLAKTKARQILFLSDCCHAGSFAGERLATQDELAEELLQKAGVIVFAASQGEEMSYEHEDWQHGAFTYALLEALSGKADAGEKDGQITVDELYRYVRLRVLEMTRRKQTPTMPILDTFDPEYVIAGPA